MKKLGEQTTEWKIKEEKDPDPMGWKVRELLGYGFLFHSIVTLSISTPALSGLHIHYCGGFQVCPQCLRCSKRQCIITLIFSTTERSDWFQTNTVMRKWWSKCDVETPSPKGWSLLSLGVLTLGIWLSCHEDSRVASGQPQLASAWGTC